MRLIAIVLLTLTLTGCSGISQEEWDAHEAKLQSTMEENKAAEKNRQVMERALKTARKVIVIQSEKLRMAEAWFRTHAGGGILPWQ